MVFPPRLRLAHRSIAALLAALLLFSWTGEALGFYPCPHHAWRAVAVAGPAHDHATGSHAAGSRLDGATTPGKHPHHRPCTCLGDCAAGATYPAAPSAPTALAPAPAAAAAPIGAGAGAVLPRHLPFVLPYGHAPPADC